MKIDRMPVEWCENNIGLPVKVNGISRPIVKCVEYTWPNISGQNQLKYFLTIDVEGIKKTETLEPYTMVDLVSPISYGID